MQEQIQQLLQVIINDYNQMGFPQQQMEKFSASLTAKYGRKYIKICFEHSVWGFIVNTDDDAKFRRGDILKPASYSAPARNQARGNILTGGYMVRWTGPLYLK